MSEIEKEKKRISATATATPHTKTYTLTKKATTVEIEKTQASKSNRSQALTQCHNIYNVQSTRQQEPKVTKEKCFAMHFFRACFAPLCPSYSFALESIIRVSCWEKYKYLMVNAKIQKTEFFLIAWNKN